MSKISKLIALVTAVVMVLSIGLTGCGAAKTDPTTAATTNAATQAAGETTAATTEAATLQEAKLTWYFPGNFPQVEQDLVFAEVNKMVKEKMNATVEFKPSAFGEYDQKMQVVIVSGEDYDICFTANWINNYNQNVAKGAFLPLDDLLVKEAPGTFANVPASMWDAAKIKGKIYGVINQQISARTPELAVPKELAEKYNLDMNALAGKIGVDSLNLLEPYLTSVTKDSPEKSFYMNLALLSTEFFNLETIVGWNVPGAVAFSDGDLKVVNQFESPEYKTYAKTMRDWNAKGLLNSKEKISKKGDDWWVDAKAKKVAAIIGGAYKPGGDLEDSGLAGETYLTAPTGTAYLTTGGIIATMHAINRNSKNPERAMMLLEYLNTDKDAYNTLNFGIKDTHFTLDADGYMVKEGDAAKAYNPSVPWMFATNFLAYVSKGVPKTVWEDTKKINATATPSKLLGFSFDAEKVKGEIGKCSAVVEEYARAIDLGVADEARYDEFLAKLKTAGSEIVIAEIQSQIDAFKASK